MSAFESESPTRLATALRALRSRNYRLFYAGQGISLIGTWMQMVATGWLVYRLSGSPYLLGVVSLVSRLPQLILTPFAGVIVDRVDRHRMIVVCQALAMLLALTLAGLTLAHLVQVWHVMLIGGGLGLVAAFEIPARQAYVVEMLEDRDDLSNAIALNSSLFNGARMIGPAIAGALTAAVGEGVCFLLNGLSYIAVIWALLAMDVRHESQPESRPPVLQQLGEGLRYAFGFPPIGSLIWLLAIVSLLGSPYMVLLPVYAKETLHGDSRTLGFLMSASGGGALLGALYLAQRRSVAGLDNIINGATVLFGLALVGVSQMTRLHFALPLFGLLGFGLLLQNASCNTVLQTLVDDDKRGRVMSLFALAMIGASTVGGYLGGLAADHFGVPHTLFVGGTACILCALVMAVQKPRLRRLAHPVYVAKGVLPEVASALRSADLGPALPR